MIKFDCTNRKNDLKYDQHTTKLKEIITKMEDGSAHGSEFLGWSEMLCDYDMEILTEIDEVITNFKSKADVMLVIGIGGSYLGTYAIDHALQGKGINNRKNLLYVGYDISSDNLAEIYEYCQNNDFVVNVISKSGNTLETALSFRIFKQLLIDKYGKDSLKDRVVITTDKESGSLRKMAQEYDIKSFEIPSDVGGRYSVFTVVGLLPLAFIDINLKELIKGASLAAKEFYQYQKYNAAFDYALNRYNQYQNGFKVEALIVYSPRLKGLIEWYKQLFAESEGKEKKGLFPTGFVFSTDLHSIGQYIQDGSNILFETTLKVNKSKNEVTIPKDDDDYDNINRLCQYTIDDISDKVVQSVIKAHSQKGDVPNYVIEIEKIDEVTLGYFMTFMMYTCAYSAYLLGVNPFNQPGVEVYKKEISKLL